MKKYLFILLALTSCGPLDRANRKLKKAERLTQDAIRLGAMVEVDSIKVKKEVEIPLPEVTEEFEFGAVVDLESFMKVSDQNDSLVIEINRIKTKSNKTEQDLAALRKANDKLSKTKDRLAKGFAKDSTYIFNPDSITEIKVKLQNGIPDLVNYHRKESIAKGTIEVPVSIDTSIKTGYSTYEIIGIGIFFCFIGILVGFIIVFFKQRNSRNFG